MRCLVSHFLDTRGPMPRTVCSSNLFFTFLFAFSCFRNYAKTHGYKLTQWGITDLKTKKVYMCKTERDIFKFLGLKYVEPEERIKNYKLEPIK